MAVYHNVKVILLQWAADDLEIDEEVERLADVFRTPAPTGYNFVTERFLIPNGDSESKLHRRLLDFRQNTTANDLLIVYYAGHASGKPHDLTWAANLRYDSPSVCWHSLQGILLQCPARVLVILDCCYADLAVTVPGRGEKWLLASTARQEVTPGALYTSFTTAFTDELKRCAARYFDKAVETSIQSMHSSISCWNRDLQYSSVLTRLTDVDAPPLMLVPDPRPRLSTAVTCPVNPSFPSSPPVTASFAANVPAYPRPAPASSRRPENILVKLKSYDTKFLIDDSASMWGENWGTVWNVVQRIAHIAVQYDSDGVDVQFFNEDIPVEERSNLKTAAEVTALLDRMELTGETPTADKLEEELGDFCYTYSQNRNIKGLNLIVLTDGDPSPGQDVTKVLVKYARKLADLQAPPLKVGVQLVQIGDDESAAKFLKTLDDDLEGPYNLDRDVSGPYSCPLRTCGH